MAYGDLETTRLPAGAVLVVGTCLAGLCMALKLAPCPVYVLTSMRQGEVSSSAWAQGGIASATCKAIPQQTIRSKTL